MLLLLLIVVYMSPGLGRFVQYTRWWLRGSSLHIAPFAAYAGLFHTRELLGP